jgi:hypothetical protein
MRLRAKIIIMGLLFTAFLYGCENEKAVVPGELTEGYWMETVTNGLLLSFDTHGYVFNYIYREHPLERMYYAYLDPAWSESDKYLIDSDNNMLFILPDRWYSILRLTYSGMILDDGQARHSFTKLKEIQDITIVSRDEFNEIFPE